jgi:hypothetical protein
MAAVLVSLFLFAAALGDGIRATHLGHPACGAECQARPSVALAHLSARAKSKVTLSTSCVANFSSIFSSRTPWRKAVMMEASEVRGTSHVPW